MSKKQDEKILKLRATLLEREQALLGTEKPVYKTGGLFRPIESSQRGSINIKIAGKSELIGALASLISHMEAAKILGMENVTFLGYTTEEWTADFKTRVSVIYREANLERVKALKAELEPLLSLGQKRTIGIDDFADKIGEI